MRYKYTFLWKLQYQQKDVKFNLHITYTERNIGVKFSGNKTNTTSRIHNSCSFQTIRIRTRHSIESEVLNVILNNTIADGLYLIPKLCPTLCLANSRSCRLPLNTRNNEWAQYTENKQAIVEAEHVVHERRIVHSQLNVHEYCLLKFRSRNALKSGRTFGVLPWCSADILKSM